MFLIPLNQPESVQLVIHSLRMAGGVADCSTCPVRRVCMKQCLTIAESLQGMIDNGTLPSLHGEDDPGTEEPEGSVKPDEPDSDPPSRNGHLKIIK